MAAAEAVEDLHATTAKEAATETTATATATTDDATTTTEMTAIIDADTALDPAIVPQPPETAAATTATAHVPATDDRAITTEEARTSRGGVEMDRRDRGMVCTKP